MQAPRDNPPLPRGFPLESYRIERQLSQGGFAIVYLAHDEAGKPVAIKEYLPIGLARRERRRWRVLVWGLRGLALLTVAVSVGAWLNAVGLQKQATSRELASRALLEIDQDPARSAHLALAAMEGVAKAVAVLFGSMLAAAMPATGAWWLLGFAAATPFLAMAVATFLVYLAVRRSPQFASDGSVSIGSGIIGALVFVAAAAMSFFTDLPGAAVVFGVVVGIGWMGLNALLAYLAVEPKPVFLRIAFLNLGGFFAAGLILAADAMLKVFL